MDSTHGYIAAYGLTISEADIQGSSMSFYLVEAGAQVGDTFVTSLISFGNAKVMSPSDILMHSINTGLSYSELTFVVASGLISKTISKAIPLFPYNTV